MRARKTEQLIWCCQSCRVLGRIFLFLAINQESNFNSMEDIIVGIDPGITVGIAVFGIEGNFILVESRRNFRPAEIRKFIINAGKPVIIASDVNPVPRSVEKIAKSFSSRLIFPEQTLTRKDKRRLARNFTKKSFPDNGNISPWKNRHERDAIAAAWHAWKRIRRSIEKTKRRET